jgi:predicted ATPase/DNA-binding winged helix-turn-helix (wHTH) protein
LLPTQRALFEGDRAVRLGGRVFDVLVALVERAGELVAHDELIARAWPNVFVDDSTLRVHIAALRKVLGHGQGDSRHIVSVSGRGYRFIAPVVQEAPTEPHPAAAPGAQPPPTFHLPARLNRMVGRSEFVDELAERLPRRRFLTIVGPGGMGKTTVALALAERIGGTCRDGARFVDLASLANRQVVASAVAAVLDPQALSSDPLADLLVHLRERQMLLLLDNCEHLVDTVAIVAEAVLANAPGVQILATSREPLRAVGEFVCRLPSLGLPAREVVLSAADALGFPAIYLFVERVIANLDGFILTDADVPVVAEICRRLDGIPLAIELAAARADFFGLRGLAQRLDDVFTALTTGRRTALARHQTLRATLDWNYGTLSVEEQTILHRLAIFRGGFSLDSAVAVAADAVVADGTIPAARAIDGVANLVAKSLVTADVSGTVVQYRLLDITLAYAAEKLSASGESTSVAHRHAVQCRALVATAESDWDVQSRGEWVDTYGRLIGDLCESHNWAFSRTGDAAIGIALTIESAPLWFQPSLMAEYSKYAERALQRLEAEAEPDGVMEMRLLVSFGNALWYGRSDRTAMEPMFTRALGIAERIGRKRPVCSVWHSPA